jgi:hypothetical protein
MFKTSVLAAVLGLSLASAASATVVIFSDNFDGEAQELNATLDQWTVTRDSVDVIGAGFFDFYPGNGNYLDLNGSTSSQGQTEGRIETGPLGLEVGRRYELSFSYGTNSNPGPLPAILTFGLGLDTQQLLINPRPLTLISVVYSFIYDGSGDYLSFADDSGTPGDQGGPVIDNISLALVPVPAGGLLLIGALGGLAALRRRKTA